MEKIESRLNKIAEHLLVGTIGNTATNISNGKPGMAIYLYYCGKVLENKRYTDVADGIICELEELLPAQITALEQNAIETGIIFEYLIQNYFIENNEGTMLELDKCFWQHFFQRNMDSRRLNLLLNYYSTRTRRCLKYPLSRNFIDNLIRLEELLDCLEEREISAQESISSLYFLSTAYHSPVKEFLVTINWEKQIGRLLKNISDTENAFAQPLERNKFLFLLPSLQKTGFHNQMIAQLSGFCKDSRQKNHTTAQDLSTGMAGMLLENIITGEAESETLSGLLTDYPEKFTGYNLPSQDLSHQLGIREGIAGVGLTLLSHTHRQYLKWVELLF